MWLGCVDCSATLTSCDVWPARRKVTFLAISNGLSATSAPVFAVERSTNDQEIVLLDVFANAVETQRTLEKCPHRIVGSGWF